MKNCARPNGSEYAPFSGMTDIGLESRETSRKDCWDALLGELPSVVKNSALSAFPAVKSLSAVSCRQPERCENPSNGAWPRFYSSAKIEINSKKTQEYFVEPQALAANLKKIVAPGVSLRFLASIIIRGMMIPRAWRPCPEPPRSQE